MPSALPPALLLQLPSSTCMRVCGGLMAKACAGAILTTLCSQVCARGWMYACVRRRGGGLSSLRLRKVCGTWRKRSPGQFPQTQTS